MPGFNLVVSCKHIIWSRYFGWFTADVIVTRERKILWNEKLMFLFFIHFKTKTFDYSRIWRRQLKFQKSSFLIEKGVGGWVRNTVAPIVINTSVCQCGKYIPYFLEIQPQLIFFYKMNFSAYFWISLFLKCFPKFFKIFKNYHFCGTIF